MDEDVNSVAARAAKIYARRCWWAEEDDLRQEALAVAHASRRTFDERVGVPFSAYAWRACVLHLARYLWRNGAPVSAPDHRLRELRGAHRSSLSEYVDLGPNVGALIDDHRWHLRVREQLTFLLQQHGEGDARVASRTLLDEEKAAAVAADEGIPVTRVYRIAARAKRLLAANALLHELHTERNEPE